MIDTAELTTLIPHKGRMFLLSRIVSWNLEEHFLAAEFDITGDCLFYREELKGLPAWAGFELIAQSISALSGIGGRARGPQYGFILSVSELVLHLPVLRGTVRIEVAVDTILDNVHSFQGRVFTGQTEAMAAKLTVMDVENIQAVINR